MDLEDIKKSLKQWENNFFQLNNKKPTKEDINEADENIKGLYKKYTILKNAKMAKIGNMCDAVWGNDLNKVKKKDEYKTPSKQVLQKKSSVMQTLSKKLAKEFSLKKTKKNNFDYSGEVEEKSCEMKKHELHHNNKDKPFISSILSLTRPLKNTSLKKYTFKKELGCSSQSLHVESVSHAPCNHLGDEGEDAFEGRNASNFDGGLSEVALKDQSGSEWGGIQVSLATKTGTLCIMDSMGPIEKSSDRVNYIDENLNEGEYVETDENDGKKVVKGSRTGMKRKLEEKSGNKKKKMRLNEAIVEDSNFVRLNMKRRRYKGKGKAQVVRKQMWKHKVSLKFGGGACFKCGQKGHWANKCLSKRGTSFEEACLTSPQPDSITHQPPVSMTQLEKLLSDAHGISSYMTQGVRGMSDAEISLATTSKNFSSSPPYCLPNQASEDVMRQTLASFGFKSFREGQQEAISRILKGESTLVVLSTGSGKSLCYQLPAFLYAQKSRCICLVVSPLVSLMQDQILDLPVNLRGACLHNNMAAEERSSVLQRASEGEYHFLLLSPEMLVSGALLTPQHRLPPISFACIDEAHCLSDWSHHFRPSYLAVCKTLRDQYNVTCVLALTATANKSTIAYICRLLHISADSVVHQASLPSNLVVTVSRDEDKDNSLIELLQGRRFSRCRSIIIYCTRREQTNKVAALIRTRMQDFEEEEEEEDVERGGRKKKKTKLKMGWSAECYHAGLTAAQRRRVQKSFMMGRLRVIVATVAFGMGLDKSDVRGVIHYDMPSTIEAYVQEMGRAGRDGKVSYCHLFLNQSISDLTELKRHIHAKSVDKISIKKFVQRVFTPCACHDVKNCKEHVIEGVDDVKNGGDDISNSKIYQSVHSESSKEVENVEGNMGHEKSNHEKNVDKKNDNKINDGKGEGDDGEKGRNVRDITRLQGHKHLRAVCIDELVRVLDLKEESISTLFCYLELADEKHVINLQPINNHVTIRFYSDLTHVSHVVKKCPGVGVLLQKSRELRHQLLTSRCLQFDLLPVASMLGCSVGILRRQLKDLLWSTDPLTKHTVRSGVNVEFSQLSFHFYSSSLLTHQQIDDIVDCLHKRLETQETNELNQLHHFYHTLSSVSYKSCFACLDEVDLQRSSRLRLTLQKYLEDSAPLLHPPHQSCLEDKRVVERLKGDIRCFLNTYQHDHPITGRVVARIFHGIDSPCFPSSVWSTVRRYWRCHLDVDFNLVRKLATSELVRTF